MSNSKKDKKSNSNTIVLNKKARHDFLLGDRFEAGIMLQGWEVKSLRAKKVQIRDSYVFIKNNEAWLSSTVITPLETASTHIHPEPQRMRKLLLNRDEITKLSIAVDRKGYTLVATAMYWKHGRAKLEIALAKGKKEHDKRATEKDRDWKREKARVLKAT
ncbi:MAG: SsrA-binding protein SmpB [Gammaproteobacteria bacterium]|nr:SsrA-binding protein SmpB [Gammaproteobacteria bacterium]